MKISWKSAQKMMILASFAALAAQPVTADDYFTHSGSSGNGSLGIGNSGPNGHAQIDIGHSGGNISSIGMSGSNGNLGGSASVGNDGVSVGGSVGTSSGNISGSISSDSKGNTEAKVGYSGTF